MAICSLCTRRRHFRGATPLHWPLVDAPGRMLELLGRQELERKRLEDGRAYLLAQSPGGCGRDVRCRSITCSVGGRVYVFMRKIVLKLIHSARHPHSHTLPCHRYPTSHPNSGTDPNVAAAEAAARRRFEAAAAAAVADGPTVSKGGQRRQQQHQDSRWWRRELRQHYLWEQTAGFLHVAIYNPAADLDRGSDVALTAGGLVVAAAAAGDDDGAAAPAAGGRAVMLAGKGTAAAAASAPPPVVDRRWARAVAAAAGAAAWAAGRLVLVRVAKARRGDEWRALFAGDAWGARRLRAPYSLSVSPSPSSTAGACDGAAGGSAAEVTLELPLPRWVVPSEDVTVELTGRALRIEVKGLPWGRLERTFWQPPRSSDGGGSGGRGGAGDDDGEEAGASIAAPGSLAWSVADNGGGTAAATGKTLTVVFGLACGDADADPRTALRGGAAAGAGAGGCADSPAVLAGLGRRGWALFEEDEDRFGLRPLLQASIFDEEGKVWIEPAPWERPGGDGGGEGSSRYGGGGGGARRAAAAAGGGGEEGGRWVRDEAALPAEARRLLQSLREAAGGGGGAEGEDAASAS